MSTKKADNLTSIVLDEYIINQENEMNWKVSRTTARPKRNLKTGEVLEGTVVEFVGYYGTVAACLEGIIRKGYANQGVVKDMKQLLARQEELYKIIRKAMPNG